MKEIHLDPNSTNLPNHQPDPRSTNRLSLLVWWRGRWGDHGDVTYTRSFAEASDAYAWLAAQHQTPMEGVAHFDFDVIAQALTLHPPQLTGSYPELLDCWNICIDIATSTGRTFPPPNALQHRVYNKLFWACNLPSVTPVGRWYEPIWTHKQWRYLRYATHYGLSVVRRAIQRSVSKLPIVLHRY